MTSTDPMSTDVHGVEVESADEPRHVEASLDMIAAGAALARPGAAVVLGCGHGAEIPLEMLGRTFADLDLVDVATDAVAVLSERAGLARIDGTCDIHQADLTGLIGEVDRLARDIVARSPEPFGCLDELGRVLTAAAPVFWRSPAGRSYDFVVCSGVLTQLPATVRESVQCVFLARFPEFHQALGRYGPWRRAVWSFARRLEDLFVAHVASMTTAGGVVYLSDAVHVCWLTQTDQGLVSEGPWIATRTERLADYLGPRYRILSERRWRWLRPEREGSYWGRLYGVQGLLCRVGD
jgi:hypothetical protein